MTLPTFEVSAYVFAAFLFAYGLVFLHLSKTTGGGEAKFLSIPTFLFMFAILYFGLSHFSMYAAMVYDSEYSLTPACEYVPSNSTTTGLVTTYAFVNTCEGDTYPEGQVALIQGFSWVLYLDLAVLMIGSFFLIMSRVIKRW